MAGINETKELLKALGAIGEVGVERFKDGVDLSDGLFIAQKTASDAEFRNTIISGFSGLSGLSEEVKDLSPEELIELLPEVLALVNKIRAAAAKKAA